jgi:hypothetical protein
MFIMEVTQDSSDKDITISGFTRRRMWFRPPTPPSSSSKGDSSNYETDFSLKFFTPPLLWDMEEMYGATKGSHQYSGPRV